jgi:aminoglycoside 6'-N-acetyltransferase
VTLRPFAAEDRAAVLEMLAHPEVERWWGIYDEARYERDFGDDSVHTYMIEERGSPAGFVMFQPETDPDYEHARIDIAVAGELLDRGLGTDALRTLLRYLASERGHHRFTIDPAVDNPRAIHVYEKVGFRAVGVTRKSERGPDDTWHDNLLMDLLAEEIAGPQYGAPSPRSATMLA